MSLYPFAKFATGLMLKLGGMRIWGWENVPEDSSVIVIANHVSFGDPPALSQAFPYHLTYIAKEDFFGEAGVLSKEIDFLLIATKFK